MDKLEVGLKDLKLELILKVFSNLNNSVKFSFIVDFSAVSKPSKCVFYIKNKDTNPYENIFSLVNIFFIPCFPQLSFRNAG